MVLPRQNLSRPCTSVLQPSQYFIKKRGDQPRWKLSEKRISFHCCFDKERLVCEPVGEFSWLLFDRVREPGGLLISKGMVTVLDILRRRNDFGALLSWWGRWCRSLFPVGWFILIDQRIKLASTYTANK